MRGRAVSIAAACVLTALASGAGAQTWIVLRTTPALTEVVAVDATGEPNWLFGQEDLAGDGPTFQQPEQSIDVRTAYAATDSNRFWVRAYVSDQNAVGGNVTVFVFIDADNDPASGGSAAAAAIDAKFTSDPTPGGYDYVIGVAGNGAITDVWEWQEPQMTFTGTNPLPAEAEAEAGTDNDPINLNGAQHGYLQATVDLGIVGLTEACAARLFVRSVNDSAVGAGDLDVGGNEPCTPVDSNSDGIPDVIVPEEGCTDDAQCPAGGICVGGECVLGDPCALDADCAADEQCSPNGTCVPDGGGMCGTTADCADDLVCNGGTCGPCALGSSDCGPGRRCAPTGRCVDDSGAGGAGGTGIALAPGEEVRGGACACAVWEARQRGAGPACLLGLAVAGLCRWRRRARPRRGGAR